LLDTRDATDHRPEIPELQYQLQKNRGKTDINPNCLTPTLGCNQAGCK
jgi:hypothetical protein